MYELMPMRHRMRPMMSFDPFREMDDLFRMDNPAINLSAFSADIIDQGDKFELNAELPGFSKEDIKLDVENDCLTISAERNFEDNEEKPNFVRRERFYGSYKRSFDLSGIDTDKIEATYNDGILSLSLPKIVEEKPAKKTLEIK